MLACATLQYHAIGVLLLSPPRESFVSADTERATQHSCTLSLEGLSPPGLSLNVCFIYLSIHPKEGFLIFLYELLPSTSNELFGNVWLLMDYAHLYVLFCLYN